MEHTPGPWKINSDMPWMVTIKTKGGFIKDFIDCGDLVPYMHIEEQVANARLIAAAPDLYFACRAALLTLEDDEYYYKYKDVVNTLRQAISKATKEGTQ